MASESCSPTSRRRNLLALCLSVPAPSIGALMSFWFFPGPIGGVGYFICKAWLYLMPVPWTLRVDRQRLSWSPPRKGGLFQGFLLGVVISLAIWLAWWLLRDRIDPSRISQAMREAGLDQPLRYILMATWLTVSNSILEEYVFRWFYISRLIVLVGPGSAVILASIFFTIHHVIVLSAFFAPPVVILCSIGVFIGGVAWGICYLKYRSIWPGAVSHAVVDAAVMLIGWQLLFG
ncbi:MAG: CPBP family intramembrane metalloprotease [Phycisphaerae bacterium]|nr:CPBP family intramembrane metalloprotease [Phycisphaerae bacterium]